jgi:uncharacterized protein YjiS (DUF1127 family)
MSAIYGTTELGTDKAPMRRLCGLLMAFWATVQARRNRHKVETALYRLNERELADIGIAQGEIEYIADNRSRGILPGEWIRNLPTVDGYIHPC